MARPRKEVIQFGLKDIDVRGQVLARLAKDLGTLKTVTANRFDTHIKNSCDIHGKGSHIKGAGPNYLKTSTLARFDLADPAVDRFIDAIAARVEKRLARP